MRFHPSSSRRRLASEVTLRPMHWTRRYERSAWIQSVAPTPLMLHEASLEIDNSAAGRALRGISLGRCNYPAVANLSIISGSDKSPLLTKSFKRQMAADDRSSTAISMDGGRRHGQDARAGGGGAQERGRHSGSVQLTRMCCRQGRNFHHAGALHLGPGRPLQSWPGKTTTARVSPPVPLHTGFGSKSLAMPAAPFCPRRNGTPSRLPRVSKLHWW